MTDTPGNGLATELAEKIHPRHTALLVVDMQNDYCHPDGALAGNGTDVSAADAIVPRLDALLAAARRAGAKVIFVRTTHDEWTDSLARKSLPRLKQMPVCRTGTWGTEYYGVAPQPGDYVITKHRYSAFLGTPLDLVLRSNGIRTLIVAGVSTHTCVDCTARDGFQRDYFVVVLSDCTATYSPLVQATTLANLERHYGDVAASAAILQAWAGEGMKEVTPSKRKSPDSPF